MIVHCEKVMFPLYPVNSQFLSTFKDMLHLIAQLFLLFLLPFLLPTSFFQFHLFDSIEEVFSVMHIKDSFLPFIDDTCESDFSISVNFSSEVKRRNL